MKLSDFGYNLPPELIARYPVSNRSASRLLALNPCSGAIKHHQFFEIVDFLKPDDLLVFNDSRVIPARLFGIKATGGKVEVLIERVLDKTRALAHVHASHSPKAGALLKLEGAVEAEVLGRQDDLFELNFLSSNSVIEILERVGHIPLPPYIDRTDENFDKERYQTVYAKEKGSVAAPTAGLHFDEKLLETLKHKGIDTAFLTLHVGAGTFQPVRVQNIQEHKMHSEFINVSEEVCHKVHAAKERGRKVIAVGTTSVRSLETAAQQGELKPYFGETDIFIYSGYKFQCVDAMITNFHLPESTLLMLVSAFAGHNNIMKAYAEAIKEKYRFYSYGDAMYITRGKIGI